MAPFRAEVHPWGMFGVKQELPMLPGLGMGQDPPREGGALRSWQSHPRWLGARGSQSGVVG